MAIGVALRRPVWSRLVRGLWLLILFSTASLLRAQGSNRFDLIGPKIDVNVTRAGKTLPIALVPNLQGGDRLTVHADLPPTQSVKLVLIVCFLRGSTNPPPDQWFTRIETWGKHIREEGVTVAVPDEAQEALMFIAPETGGDFSTLRSAIRGRPGVFVRASQDLNEASFEQSRIEHYLQSIRRVPPGSPEELLDHSHKLAATLNLKPNDDCFKRAPDMQLACLRQTGNQVLLDDGHGQSLATLVTSGASADLIGSVAGSPMVNAGSYSAYVGTIIDVVRLMSGLHTAQFQYIPAIAFPEEQALNLRLNTPPSFHNPKSVIVIALPAIQKAAPPPLRLQNPDHVSCLLQPASVLPLEGAPLVFATGFAHGMTLHLASPTEDGRTDLSLTPDAYEGGLVIAQADGERRALDAAATGKPVAPQGSKAAKANTKLPASDSVLTSGIVRGYWGFDPFEGPAVPLQRLAGRGWSAEPKGELIAGKTNDLLLHADGTACTESIRLEGASSHEAILWKQDGGAGKAGAVDVKLPLDKAAPGGLKLLVRQFGTPAVSEVGITAYADTTRPETLQLHAGDATAVLSGSGLGEVKTVEIAGAHYTPARDGTDSEKSIRLVSAANDHKKAASFKPGEGGEAHVNLADGRSLPLAYRVQGSRPAITLLSKTVQPKSDEGPTLTLTGKDAIPLTSRLSFAIRSDSPARFPRSEKVEIATADESLKTILQISDSSLILQDASTAVGFLSPGKAFGQSAFGPLQIRAVSDTGSASDWQPLGTLVRTPDIQGATRRSPENSCTLTGDALFLIDSVSPDSSFSQAYKVPVGYSETTLEVPRPADNRTLFLRLRDDPDNIAEVLIGTAANSRRPNGAAATTTSQVVPRR